MHTRRNIMLSIAGGTALSVAPTKMAAPKPIEICRKEAGQLAEVMQKLCGGHWKVSVDRNLEFVLISKVL